MTDMPLIVHAVCPTEQAVEMMVKDEAVGTGGGGGREVRAHRR